MSMQHLVSEKPLWRAPLFLNVLGNEFDRLSLPSSALLAVKIAEFVKIIMIYSANLEIELMNLKENIDIFLRRRLQDAQWKMINSSQ